MNKTEYNLTDKQLKAIPTLIEAKNISEGVGNAGISRVTFYEWLKLPGFKKEYIRQQQEVVDFALHGLKASAGEAVEVLRGLLKAKNESIRFRAAQCILENIGKFVELEKIEARIEALEKEVKQ